jgi:hypothetical protein
LPIMRESDVEKYLIKRVKELGGEIRKTKWIGRSHAPDRVVFFKGVWFVELKRPNAAARAGQVREHSRMRQHGAAVFVINTIEQVDEFINEICSQRIPEDCDRLDQR